MCVCVFSFFAVVGETSIMGEGLIEKGVSPVGCGVRGSGDSEGDVNLSDNNYGSGLNRLIIIEYP